MFEAKETVLVIGGTGAQGVPVVKGIYLFDRLVSDIYLPFANLTWKLWHLIQNMPYASSPGIHPPQKLNCWLQFLE